MRWAQKLPYEDGIGEGGNLIFRKIFFSGPLACAHSSASGYLQDDWHDSNALFVHNPPARYRHRERRISKITLRGKQSDATKGNPARQAPPSKAHPETLLAGSVAVAKLMPCRCGHMRALCAAQLLEIGEIERQVFVPSPQERHLVVALGIQGRRDLAKFLERFIETKYGHLDGAPHSSVRDVEQAISDVEPQGSSQPHGASAGGPAGPPRAQESFERLLAWPASNMERVT